MTVFDNYLFYNFLYKGVKMKVSRIKQRVIWTMNPVTRVVPSKKNYKRTKAKAAVRREVQLT